MNSTGPPALRPIFQTTSPVYTVLYAALYAALYAVLYALLYGARIVLEAEKDVRYVLVGA